MKWTKQRDVTVPPLMSGDELIWWRHSLCLTINRHCSEAYSDDDVSAALKQVDENIELPITF